MASVYSGAGEGSRGNVTVKGEVQFSLLYNYRMGALEVGVKRCRDLASVDVKKNRSDPYVKVIILNFPKQVLRPFVLVCYITYIYIFFL